MVTRRELLGATAAGVTVGAAGCSAIPFLGNEPLEFEATRATVPASTREETGYEEKEVAQDVIERTFEVAGQSQDVVVTNWQAECDKAIDVGDLVEQDLPTDESARAAIFTVLSTPQVSVLGRSFNPVEDMDSRELAQQVQDNYDGMEDIEQVGEDGALVAGQETTAGEFSTEAQLAETDRTVELAMHITEAVEVGEDFVVAVGAYPRPVREVERDNVFAMMEAVEHEGGE
ncbi:hypothetical protein BRD09_03860 [Halobacteriales archaeon SW_10_68_16]|jgi:hypothetical protein|nr:MAG: hypothetical protein BRD09_03860 [Halobacteriales archaeon SW_10_68_16]